MNLQPYLFFDGRCEEAVEFYKRALGAQVTFLLRNREAPVPPPPDKVAPGNEDKVMHCEVKIGDVGFMASDGFCAGRPDFKGFSLALTLADETRVDRAFNALAEQGRVDMPLSPTFWSKRFGMITDRFGVQWMLSAPPADPAH